MEPKYAQEISNQRKKLLAGHWKHKELTLIPTKLGSLAKRKKVADFQQS